MHIHFTFRKGLSLALALQFTAVLFSCGSNESKGNEDPAPGDSINQNDSINPGDSVAPGDSLIVTSNYPAGMSVEEFTDTFSDGKTTRGFIVTVDISKNPDLRFNVTLNNPRKTPTDIFSDFKSKKAAKYGMPYVLTNAGYFAGSTSVSLCIQNGDVRTYSSTSINWPSDEEYECTVYPVRSAIGQMEDGTFEIQWIYCTDRYNDTQTAFPSTMGNNEQTRTFLQTPPTADAEGAFTWEPCNAVSGGPRLLKDGVDVSTESYWGECLDAGGTDCFSRNPRTAAGICPGNVLKLLVCDGRGMKGSAGMTLAEVAAKLKAEGCTDALNLDGGGSSQIVGYDGQILNWPSDGSNSAYEERKISTGIVISQME